MAGYGFYQNLRGTGEIGGVFFKMGRGLGGILAGYLNCWRPNLPISYNINKLRYNNIIPYAEPLLTLPFRWILDSIQIKWIQINLISIIKASPAFRRNIARLFHCPIVVVISNLDAARIFPFLNLRLIKIFTAIIPSLLQIKKPCHPTRQLGF